MVKLPVKFPAKAFALKSSGAVVIIHPCCMCGEKHAPFGKGLKIRGLHNLSLGYWFCEMNGECEQEFDKQFPDAIEKPIPQSVQLKLF